MEVYTLENPWSFCSVTLFHCHDDAECHGPHIVVYIRIADTSDYHWGGAENGR